MSEALLADALARLDSNKTLRLPLRSRDLFGRLLLRLLWRRQLKWQVETNLAAHDAIGSLRDITDAHRAALAELTERIGGLASQEQLSAELDGLRRADQNLTAGMNQRLYAAIGGLRTELSDLRLHLADKTEHADGVDDRLAGMEQQLAELVSAARDTRSRHAQVDLFLDRLRPNRTEQTQTPAVPDRAEYLELAVADLLDGPAEHTRTARAAYLPVIEAARATGAIGAAFDMAPARGEWLDVLRAAGVPGRTATANPVVARHNTELGHQLQPGDPLSVLAETGRQLGAVTAFRYVERLAPATLARFVDLAAVALQPGGVLVVETATPDGPAGDFGLDPFARQPVHPTFLRFLAEAAGFARVELRYPDAGPCIGWPAEAGARTADRYCLLAWM